MKESHFLYTGSKTKEISFPLGGIGTGCIGLAGNGRLVDWEIYNKPNKGSINGFSHFAIRAEAEGRVVDARVLNGDLQPPYAGSGREHFTGFGFGPDRGMMAGVPHFESADFRGEFPIAHLEFKGAPAFPGRVSMTAFNPFIPLNDVDSGIPAAFFEFEVTNTSDRPLDYTLAGTLGNPLPAGNLHVVEEEDGLTLLRLSSDGLQPEQIGFGDLTLGTDAPDVSWQRYWYSGEWFDQLEIYWRDFLNAGKLVDRGADATLPGKDRHAMLAAHFTLGPGESRLVRFVISWSFPNCENYWNPGTCSAECECARQRTWKNYYATIWRDSGHSARYALENWDRLRSETVLFKEALFASSIPDAALDAVSANISILKTPTVMRLEDGTFYGWEGCQCDSGCCEGSCTHVWNYAQALPFLFPALERSMREADYTYNLLPTGAMPFRLQLPLGSEPWAFRPCVDGQFGGVMKVYRDWKISGDTKWLERLWPAVRKSIEFAWSADNPDRWDPKKTGVIHGRQHHTLDMELFGPNSWLTGFYLGALKAGAEMADEMGETETAAEYRTIFERGKQFADLILFNGRYYHQCVDIRDRATVEKFEGAAKAYWNEEHQEIKYQIADGCQIDQVLAQWHANLYGLGEVFDPERTRTALQSLFEINFRSPMREHFNACRVFSLNDESGLVIGQWPEGTYRPMIPIPYTGETMPGFEYAAAVTMIQAGLTEQGMSVVEAIRERYDGERRNPWNEIECGSNYARSMASYSLLNAFGGFEFDLSKGRIGFHPLTVPFRTFWSLGTGWGTFSHSEDFAELAVLGGSLELKSIDLPLLASRVNLSARMAGETVESAPAERGLAFASPVRLETGSVLVVG